MITINGITFAEPDWVCSRCGAETKTYQFLNSNKSMQARCADCDKWLGNVRYATPEAFTMPFGKHKGEKLEDIPKSYLEWLSNNCETLSANLSNAIKEMLGEGEKEPDYLGYAAEKQKLWNLNLSSEEYEKRLKIIVKKYGV